MKFATGTPGELCWLSAERSENSRRIERLVNNHIRVLGVLDKPLIRRRVTAKDYFEPRVFNDKADWTIAGVNGRN